jgi:hypothetical protein
MNDSEKFRHFSVINDFLRRHEDYTPSNREEYEKFKKQLLSLNKPLKNMNTRDLLVRKKNTQLKNMYIETRKRFHAVERKERSKGLVDITSPKVQAYLDEFKLIKTAANTPLPQPTPSPIEIEQEAVSCKSCFGRRRKTKKNKGERYDEFYGGKRRRRKKKKTRKKRGGVRRWTREILVPNPETFDDMGYFYDCQPTMENPSNKSKYRENMIITGDRDGNELTLPDEWKIIRMDDSEFYDPQLQLVDMALPEGERGMRWFRRRAQDLCNRGYKPLERNDAKTGAGRKKKTRKKRKKKQFLYNPDDPSKSFDVYIDKNPKDTIPIKYTTVKDVKDTIKKLERLYKTKKYPHKRIWQVGMIMKVRLEAMLKHKTKKYPNAKKVKQRFNLANKYFKFLGKRTKKKDFKSRKAMNFKL